MNWRARCGSMLLAAGSLMVACGSDSDSSPAPAGVTFQKNDCVTAGAAYKYHYEEQSGGTCGPVADAVINVPTNGQISTPTCDRGPRYEGCDVFLESINCEQQGANVKQNGKITWAADGSTGTGFITFTVSQSGFDPCTSTYAVTGVRL